ncbi:MAG: complex I NDUFA9 subunit family protein [Alphaproteobacteria bacterium]|nr:MAG: complex I NDUFA9 subunit family protein [Alphaproteobacteria bacterium]
MSGKLVTVFGGSGFLGRHIVRALAREGHLIRVAVRRPNDAYFLQPSGGVGQIQFVQANVKFPESVAKAVEGAEVVINLTGILTPTGKQSFDAVHHKGAAAIAQAAQEAGAETLIHMSAIGADAHSDSKYAASKGLGEEAVRAAFPSAVILRPSVVFGPEDEFFNRFAALARIAPVMPLIGGGATRFQPVYVGDVARAVLAAMKPVAAGQTFELGGPEVMSLKDVYALVLKETQRKRPMVSIPFGLASFEAFFLGMLPKPLLTMDQVKLLKHDNVVGEGARTLADLGVDELETAEMIVPTYLYRFRPAGQFDTAAA